MSKEPELKPCPFCGGDVEIIATDDEGNIHRETEYESKQWSGLQYGISHEERYNPDCPIATFEDELLGSYLYDTKEELIEFWNRRSKNEV